MKKMVIPISLLGAICFIGAAPPPSPPAIKPAELQSYAHGAGSISGTIAQYTREEDIRVYCAPDVPYTEWYVAQLGSSKPASLDPQIKSYVRRPSLTVSRVYVPKAGPQLQAHFTCNDLAPGHYLVWIEGSVPAGGHIAYLGMPTIAPRPPVENARGEPEDAIPAAGQFSTSEQPGFMQTYVYGSPRMVPLHAQPVHVDVTSGETGVTFY